MPAAERPVDELRRQAALDGYGIVGTDPDGRFDSFVRLAADLYRVPIAAVSLIDRDRQWFKSIVGLAVRETPRTQSFCAHAILTPSDLLVVEDAHADPRFRGNALVNDDPRIRFYAGAPICSPDGQPLGTLCIIDRVPRRLDPMQRRHLADLALGVSAMLDLHRSALRLEAAATRDPLTGVANRTLFEPRLERAVAASSLITGDDRPCALLMLDLDCFKSINDTYGHAGGDALLVETARRLVRSVRDTDLVARLGGDEFAILLEDLPQAGPLPLAERLLMALAHPFALDGTAVPIRASVGIASCPSDARQPAALLRAADAALYHAKTSGRGRVARFRDLSGPGGRQVERTLEADLRHALAHDEVALHYQPYLRITDGVVIGHEALMRWERPGHGPVGPAQFIPVAESSGLIGELDRWVISTACRHAAAWPVAQKVAVNVSAYWFSRGELSGIVETALTRFGLPANRLVIELTERTLLDQHDTVQREIERLNAMGARVALDDFGTGYSSLGSLKAFRFDKLKLDRSFIRDLGVDDRADAVVRAILQLGRALDMAACAEGVETSAQLDFLRREGCQMAQGYLLGRPTPVPQFVVAEAFAAAGASSASTEASVA